MPEKWLRHLKEDFTQFSFLGQTNVAQDSGSTVPPVGIVFPLPVYWLCDHAEKQPTAVKGKHLLVVIPHLADLAHLGQQFNWRKSQE